MGRTKGSKNKPTVDNSTPIVQEKTKQVRKSKNDGFLHGPCGQFWPNDAPTCPTCANN